MDVIERYFQVAQRQDHEGVAACFSEDGVVVDEGRAYRGRPEIQGWREATAGTWTYTVTVLDTEHLGGQEYKAHTLVRGDFPGGEVKLTFRFTLRDGLIARLHIGEQP
ncbi:nuclear transport factor 2 family protein [Sphaerisporangium dianthi]|uniref:Nuclear transport factor 2 family protein n=1 Tax=Sphaerisporangium dianthi TaxID=1436120 RepID=A0ABV9CD10_9ACTN